MTRIYILVLIYATARIRSLVLTYSLARMLIKGTKLYMARRFNLGPTDRLSNNLRLVLTLNMARKLEQGIMAHLATIQDMGMKYSPSRTQFLVMMI